MLRPYTPNRKELRSADPRSVRGGAPSFSITETPAADNNLASKTPKSDSSRMFPEVGAEHMNSSRRSCVTCFFSAVPHPFFLISVTAYQKNRLTILAKARRALRRTIRCGGVSRSGVNPHNNHKKLTKPTQTRMHQSHPNIKTTQKKQTKMAT